MLVLDALNEAPFAERVIDEALEMIGVAACYPWCKVVVSTRQEWLSLWSARKGAQEGSGLEEQRAYLHVSETERGSDDAAPVVMMEPFTEEQAQGVYEGYQRAARGEGRGDGRGGEGHYRIPACTTEWEELPDETRGLLANPLYLHLFMDAFDGHAAEEVATVPVLFRRYVERSLRERPGLGGR